MNYAWIWICTFIAAILILTRLMGTVLFRHFDTDEFRRACYACNVDPDSLTQSDLNKLQKTESADIGNGIWEKL